MYQTIMNTIIVLQTEYVYLIITFVFVCLYIYTTRNHRFWQKRGIPGRKPLPFFGNMLDTLTSTGPQVEQERFKKYGKIYGTFQFQQPILHVADPNIVKLIAVKDWHLFINRTGNPFDDDRPEHSRSLVGLKDEEWKAMRALLSPTFTSGKIRKMTTLMQECVEGVLHNLDIASKTGDDVDLKKLFGAYTMDVIAKCAFGTITDAHTNPDDPFIKNAKALFEPSIVRVLWYFLTPKFLRRLLDIQMAPKETRVFFDSVTRHLLHQRRNGQIRLNDFVQLLVDAEKNQMDNKTKDLETELKFERSTRKNYQITDDEAVAQMTLFFMAGYETTGGLLWYSAYCLALNPNIQDYVYDELQAAFKVKGDSITYDDINRLEYLNAVISETLRLYPPILRLDRVASKDYNVEGTDLVIPKGTSIMLGFYALHHDEDNFEEPYQFKPERFLKENLQEIKPYTYLPFGVGPRNCIGMRFALAEAKVALFKILLKYKFIPSEKTKVPLEFTVVPIMMQAKEVILKVERR